MRNRPVSPIPADAATVAVPFAAIVLAMLPAVLDQTILATALPTIAGDLGRLSDVSWVVTRLRRRRRRDHAAVGQARRPPRPQAAAPGRAGRLRRRVGAVRRRAGHHPADRRSRMIQGVAAGGLMTLAMAAVGDLVAPRERGRYQGYIAADVRGRDRRRAAAGRRAGRARELALGLLGQPAARRWSRWPACPAPAGAADRAAATARSTSPAPALLAGATSALMLTCIWGGERYAWDSAPILALIARDARAAAALFVRERRAADPIVPLDLLRTRVRRGRQRRAVPRHRRAVRGHRVRAAVPADGDGREPDPGRAAAGAGDAGHHGLERPRRARRISRTGRYKRFPIAGLALMAARSCCWPGSPASRRGSPQASAWPSSASASAWSARC